MITILRALEKAREVKPKKKQVEYLLGFYQANPTFKKYMDLCYSENPFITKLPKYTPDEAPAGLALSTLEYQYKKFYSSVYSEGYTDEVRNKMLVQVLESIDQEEVKFLKEIITGSTPRFPKDAWEGLNNANV